MRRFPSIVLALSAAAACSQPDSATIQILTDGTNTFTESPACTQLVIDQVDTSGTRTTLATASLPATTINLGTQSETTEVALEARGLDAKGDLLVFGATLPFQYGSVVGDVGDAGVPLFAQRIGSFARMPGPLPLATSDAGAGDPRQAPLLAVVQGQYLFFAGGAYPDGGAIDAAPPTPLSTTQLYDFFQFAPLAGPPSLPSLDGGAPFAPTSVAFVGTVGWFLGPQGGLYFDLGSNSGSPIVAPSGGSFSDVAGGITVTDDKGAQYIVGATRATGAPSALVLKIDPNDTSNASYPSGNPTWLTLTQPRLGASAAWVTGRGLVVVGGSATAAGVELIAPAASTASALSYPPDPSTGSGATALDGQHVLVAGGILPGGQDAAARSIDLACTTAPCTPTVWASLPIPIGTASAFSFSATDGLVIGNEPASGLTHAFRLTAPGTDAGPLIPSDVDADTDASLTAPPAPELPLPTNQGSSGATITPLRNARATWSPVGSVVVFGGFPVIDSFRAAP